MSGAGQDPFNPWDVGSPTATPPSPAPAPTGNEVLQLGAWIFADLVASNLATAAVAVWLGFGWGLLAGLIAAVAVGAFGWRARP